MSQDDDDWGEPQEEVGYRKPPKAHQFKKGESGNPRGRPKKPKPRKRSSAIGLPSAMVILNELRRPIQVREGDQSVELSYLEALIRSLILAGMKGNRQSQVDVIKLGKQAEAAVEQSWREAVDQAIEYKLTCQRIYEDCDACGEPRPDIVPHPDDVVIDDQHRRILINGPADEAEKAIWDKWEDGAEDAREEIEFSRKWLQNRPLDPSLERIRAMDEATIAVRNGIFPSAQIRRAPGFDLHAWRRKNGILAQLKREGFRSFVPERFRIPLSPPDDAVA